MKIAILGSSNYPHKRKFKDFLFYLKTKYGEELSIISSGTKVGVEKLAKEYALDLKIRYIEIPPIHDSWNMFCEGNGLAKYRFNKRYSPKNFFIQKSHIVTAADMVIVIHTDDTPYKHLALVEKAAKKQDKKILIMG